MRYLLVLLGLMFANVAEAVIDCKTPPNCADLGYSKDNDPNCLKDGYMYCPFDPSYKKCVEHDCALLGFTTDDKSSWCTNLLRCKTNESYTACLSAPREAVTCEGFTLNTCPANAICSECTDKNGKKFKLEACRNGYAQSGNLCNVAGCPSGYQTKIQSTSNCSPQGSGWEYVYNGFSGTQKCGRCICTKTCSWNDKNKGMNSNISELCCDGNYAKCTSTCKKVTVPEHAEGTTQCTGCNETVYTAWICNMGFRELNNTCVAACEVGDVFYADGSCGKVSAYVVNSSLKPVGVVYYISDDGTHGKVINLHDLSIGSNGQFDPENPYSNSLLTFEWGGWGTDIDGLKNWDCNNGGYESTAKTGDHSHEFWSGGKKYTDLIAKAVGETNLQYAAPAVKAFYPDKDLENDSRVGKGQWHLPTLGELMDLYGSYYLNVSGCDSSNIGSNGTIKAKVNETLAALKNKSVPAEKLTDNYYWSSSEVDNNSSWKLKLDSGTRYWDGKGHGANVRASLAF